ncbi:MAG TPA: hypothetical protein VFK05_38780 [Polyangiaceae bacterium]|nr:hypothetical protein [Polyangiaceae bacterium]
MDPDEGMVLVGSLAISCVAGIRWYLRLARAGAPYSAATPSTRLILGALPIVLLVALGWALRAGAAREVRGDSAYLLLFLTLGATWMVLTWKLTAWLGIDVGDDALERNNTAACVAACGALVGSMTIYAFANLGEGPTIWTTIGPATLGAFTGLVLTAAYQSLSGAADAITIDRDLASGARFAGLVLAGGLIVGHPLAGDYISAPSTFADFYRAAWPALPLVAVAASIERRLRPSSERPRPAPLRYGLLPALAYVTLGAIDVIYLGYSTASRAPR